MRLKIEAKRWELTLDRFAGMSFAYVKSIRLRFYVMIQIGDRISATLKTYLDSCFQSVPTLSSYLLLKAENHIKQEPNTSHTDDS